MTLAWLAQRAGIVPRCRVALDLFAEALRQIGLVLRRAIRERVLILDIHAHSWAAVRRNSTTLAWKMCDYAKHNARRNSLSLQEAVERVMYPPNCRGLSFYTAQELQAFTYLFTRQSHTLTQSCISYGGRMGPCSTLNGPTWDHCHMPIIMNEKHNRVGAQAAGRGRCT